MPRGKAEQAEHIIPKLREVEVELVRGKTVAEAVKKIGVTEQTYCRWTCALLRFESLLANTTAWVQKSLLRACWSSRGLTGSPSPP